MSVEDEKDLPLGRFGRLARLAAAGARTDSTLLFAKDARKGAARSAAILGQLRGAAAKVGQMVSYVDGLVPPEHRDAFESTMGMLRDAAPQSSPEEIRSLLESQLGESISDLFSEWDDEPMASASIGQVHRAKLPDGTPVAVKVQHPGIIEAMESDLKNAAVVEAIIATMGMAKFESKRLTEEVKDRFREELDYNLEADRQEAFTAIHAGDSRIRIPRIFDTHSSSRVLTAELLTGRNFDQARTAPEELRRSWAETLWRFVYKAILVDGYFNADPHPGNYFFHESGVVTFVDFGCVQKMPEVRRNAAIRMHWGANHGDQMMFDRGCRDIADCEGGLYEKLVLDYLRSYFRPITDSPFHLSPDYAAHVVRTFKKDYAKALRNYKDGFVPMPEGLLFINRLEFGFFSIIARLNVTVDFRKVEAAYVSQELIDQALLEMPVH